MPLAQFTQCFVTPGVKSASGDVLFKLPIPSLRVKVREPTPKRRQLFS